MSDTSGSDPVSAFYYAHLDRDGGAFVCPFCVDRGKEQGRLKVVLNRNSFLHGFFCCSNRCVPGGFPLWFARLAGILPEEVPGWVPGREAEELPRHPPVSAVDDEIRGFAARLDGEILDRYRRRKIARQTLAGLKIGFNGRYLVFPRIQENGICYAARCVHPDTPADSFWHGSEEYSREPFNLFNSEDLRRCENGALMLCEGEENAIVLKQLGFPAVAVADCEGLARLDPGLFSRLDTLLIIVCNRPQSMDAARRLASRVGFRARIVLWPAGTRRDFDLFQLALTEDVAAQVMALLSAARPFSPFSPPAREFSGFTDTLLRRERGEWKRLVSGFSRFDTHLSGIRGINVLGGAPKAGKSTWVIQIATDLAERGVPVLYYDFENGRQSIYERTVSRLARLETAQLGGTGLSREAAQRLAAGKERLAELLVQLRVISERSLTPALMRKHIEFIRYETRSDACVVVVDSLHKLPFKEFGEKRAGIDGWLREFESMRDALGVSFLVLSELTRQQGGSYDGEPHMGMFKGSGDIEYSADNAFVFIRRQDADSAATINSLWLVASREHPPGHVADYRLDYPYWGFVEEDE